MSHAPQESKAKLLKGIVLMCIAAFFNVVTSCLAQQIMAPDTIARGGKPSITDLLFFRNFLNFIFQVSLSRYLNEPSILSKRVWSEVQHKKTLLVRVVVPSVTFVMTCLAL